MTRYPSDKSLINYEKMEREVICLNPAHETVIINSLETQPKCPLCESIMVVVVKSVLDGQPFNPLLGKK